MKHWLLIVILGLLLPTHNIIKAQNNVKEWLFVNKNNGEESRLRQGQVVTVDWQGKLRLHLSGGKLVNIAEDSLLLERKGHVVSFAKKDIVWIYTKKHDRKRGILLILLGVLLVGFFILLQALYDTNRLDVQSARREHAVIWPMAGLGLVIISSGIVGLNQVDINIKNPFDKNYTVLEIPIKSDNMP